MKKSLFVLSAILLVALLAGITSIFAAGNTVTAFVPPEYAKKFTGYRSLTGIDTVIGDSADTIITNLHTCYENYFAPGCSVGLAHTLLKTVWCIGAYADADGDSVDWLFSYSSSYDSIHWVYYPIAVRDTLNVSADSLVLFEVPKDADLFEWFRIIRTGGAGNNADTSSIGEILLFWQLRGPKIGNEVGLQD